MVYYPNLIGEMAKRQITRNDVADCIGVCYKALVNKITGRVAFTLPEARKIRRELFSDIPTDELFITAAELESAQDSA